MLKTNAISSLLSLLIFILLLGSIKSQEYIVTIWSIPVGTAEIQQDADDEITFNLKSNVFIDYVFPVNLEYYSKFDKTNHTVIENKKTIEQGK
ncbi:MAG: hypothetical protein V3S42_01215, partial [Candidatus Neomarinimicrobiota bacterium]